jgi:membrane protein required for colicin V production
MNLLDFIILLPVIWLIIRGFQKGLILELASLIGIILGIIAAYYFANNVQNLIKEYFSVKEQTSRIIAYIAIFLTVMIIVYLIGKMLEGLIDVVAMGWLNKLLGAIVGLAKGIVVVCIILYIFEKTDTHQNVITPGVKAGSFFYQPCMQLVHWVVPGE